MAEKDLFLNKKYDFSTLSKVSFRGGVINIVTQIISFLVQFGTLALMARIIPPSGFGIVAMASSVTGFILIFKDLGLSMATIQREEINNQQISNLFWINLFVGIILGCIIVLISPLVASFFEQSEVEGILLVSSIGLIIGALTIQHQALLRRQMKFYSLAKVDLGSKVLGSIVSLLVAFYFKNFWALVLLPIFISSFYLIGIFLILPWRPNVYKRKSNTTDFINFGKNMTFYGILNYFSRTGDNIIIGKFLGANSLGFYSRAYSLMMLPIAQLIAPLTGVVVPTLSRLQNEPEHFRFYYNNLIKVVAYVSFPLVCTLGVLGKEVVFIVLGEEWSASVVPYQILCLAAFWQPILNSTGWILTSLNKTKRLLIWGLIHSLLLIITFLISVKWGIIGIATGYAIYYWIILIPYFWFVTATTPVKLSDLFQSVGRPLLSTSLFGISLFFIIFSIGEYIIWRVLSGLLLLFSYWVLLYIFDLNFRKIVKRIIAKINPKWMSN